MKFKVGDRVKVHPNNDNDGYDSFRDKILIITHADNKGIGYDEGMYPQGLYSFKDEEGREIGSSLYDYELRKVYKR